MDRDQSGRRGLARYADWVDDVFFSKDPTFIPSRATFMGSIGHSNVNGLATGASYTASTKIKLPPGTDGPYYIYVITDAVRNPQWWGQYTAQGEINNGGNNDGVRDFYTGTVYEGALNNNNMARGASTLPIASRICRSTLSRCPTRRPRRASRSPLPGPSPTAARETRTNGWFDGVYLSRDDSLDSSDYPLVDRGSNTETLYRIRSTALYENNKPKYLKPGESYTNSATFNLPESISGNFHIIVKADTSTTKDFYHSEPSTIRDGLDNLDNAISDSVKEFKDEGNNVASIALPITLVTPPDLQVASVTAPASVLAGQSFNVTYQVINAGGNTPNDQSSWNDLIYLSKDRFLDINQDRYVGYIAHGGGLAAGGSYGGSLTVTAPRDLEGAYYVFVITDPARAWGGGEFGRVREFGKEQNNTTAAVQPIIVETPPPADLKVSNVVVPAQANVGDEIQINYTVVNDSINTAYGHWTDALYLSSDNAWDLGDTLLGKVDHNGDLGSQGSYSGLLKAKLPPLKDGNWRIIVRPDLYNEVYEGKITYTPTGLNLPPGEANNRIASGSTLQVQVPVLGVASPLQTTLTAGQARLYKVSVASGETLRITLDSSATDGSNELYIRYGDIPTGFAFDAAYSNPVAADQQVMIPTTQAGDYYVLVRARQGGETAVTLRADLLPLSITKVTPDQGGTGDDDHRWVTFDIYGSSFKAGALVKLSRPGVYEVEPDRWQVLDATHIRAIFDLRTVPHGLYDVVVTNPDGTRVVEANRYLVERGIEADVTIGVGGPRTLSPGDNGLYSVSLQSLTNVDTPYVRFDFGATEMGYSDDVLEGLGLPYVLFGANVGGSGDGRTTDAAGNTQTYGPTPTSGLPRADVPWAKLDGAQDTGGFNLAPGYAFDVAAGGFVGMSFNLQTYPGLKEWLNYDFEGLRDKLYATHPDWKAQGLLDGGVQDLNKIQAGLAAKFLSHEEDVHITKLEALAMPFRFNLAGAATALTRDEFIAEQTEHAQKLRTAILADATAPSALGVLAADSEQWTAGWLGALEAAGLLRPLSEAPPIRENPKVISLNATLGTGILLAKGGESYSTQADLLGFFAKVQQWYGDTAKWAGDPDAAKAEVEYEEVRTDENGNEVYIPVPKMADAADFDRHAQQETQFLNFNVFAGGSTELEYLRHIGVLDANFNPVSAQALNLTQYLQQAAQQNADAQALISVRGPQGALAADGTSYVPAATPLPYTVSFNNSTNHAVGQIRIVSQLDADLDPRSLRLGDLKLGDINVHIPADKANFQGDFDFTGNKGFILRVSAGIDVQTRTATWLLQAIDPDTGEVMHDPQRGLLAPSIDPNQANADQLKRGFVSYTVQSLDIAHSNATISASARIFLDDVPPVDSSVITSTLDAHAPVTVTTVTSLGNNADGEPSFDVTWSATDDASGVKSVTVYVAEDGGDFKIWKRQVDPGQTQAVFNGVAGKRYEFLAVAVDNAGNREAAAVANAVLPDDGTRQAVLDGLGVIETLSQTAELPLAAPDRSYESNTLFEQATHALPGQKAPAQPSDLNSVLAPFTLRGFADGFAAGDADIGALAMVELADHSVLVSGGSLRNEVFRYGKDGGRSTTPLFTLDVPVIDMAVDSVGQLWVMTGSELLQVDADSGAIVRRMNGPGQDPLTHALAIQKSTGDIYVSSGNGIEIFRPNEIDPTKSWKHFSNQRVGDLAFGADGRLWAVRWTGATIASAVPGATTDIVSFPMSGRTVGRPELEYRLNGIIDSIAFGAAGTELDGVMVASSNLKQRPVVAGATDVPHQASVWMIELQSRRAVQVAAGGTRGESIVATSDGRILVAQTGHVDEIAPLHAPKVTAISVPDGSLVPLPVGQVAVTFDQAMWLGAQSGDDASVLDPENFTFTALGANAGRVIVPQSVRWDALRRTAYLDVNGLPAGQYQFDISGTLRSQNQARMAQGYVSTFTAVLDMSSQVRVEFSNTRADRATGEVSYDVSLTNIGTDDLNGPLMLLLDPGLYFGDSIAGTTGGNGDQSDLWILNVTAGLQALGGKLAVGATLANQTITVMPANRFGTQAGMASLAKFNLGHGVYAVPQENIPPVLTVAGADNIDADTLEVATAGQLWTGQVEAIDSDGTQFFWELVQAPQGVTLTPLTDYLTSEIGYHSIATLNWTPTTRDLANSEIVVRVQDSRGGVAFKRFVVPVIGGNNSPTVDAVNDIALTEGETLSLPLTAADADGDRLTVTIRNLPAGAVFNAATGMLTWVPGYDQAGTYNDVTVIASDGKATVSQSFNITVEQGYAKPTLAAVAPQVLREGDRYALQLAGDMPGGLPVAGPPQDGQGPLGGQRGVGAQYLQADGTTIALEYSAPWLPGGATLNSDTGWFEWTPDFAQHGSFTIPFSITATFTPPDGETVVTTVTRNIVFNVLNTNGAPVFDASETWNVLEGQPLTVSVFAFDPDNPGFEPKVRLTPTSPATGGDVTAATVTYQVSGLPAEAVFDQETLEIIWTPGYTQAGTYSITVTATDDGDSTGTPAVSQLTLPIVVSDANRAPEIGDVSNAFVDKGATLDIPVNAVDADGNPLEITLFGLPRFATYTQNPSNDGAASGTVHFAPGTGDRGDYAITVVARDNGSGNVNQVLTQAKTFVLTVRSPSEPPVVTAPSQVVAVVGQPVSVPISVRDMDQDALTYSALGLPSGAELTALAQYGQAMLTWTPTAGDVGPHDIEILVTDSGLGPQDAGYQPGNDTPVPNVVTHRLRVIVRSTNAAPELLGVQVNGAQVTDSGDPATALQVSATEGSALSIELFGRDADTDLINWSTAGLPRGMTFEVPAAGNGSRVVLNWTPDLFAAQDSNTGTPGLWRFTVKGSDGSAEVTRTFEIAVTNFNQTPRILPMPLQLVSEDYTLSFTVRTGDADSDIVQTSLIYDDSTPAGVFFDGSTGYFEWTPDQNAVNNAAADNTPYTLTFSATDGVATTTQTVQVRVFDVNRVPRLTANNHAVVTGQTISIPVQLGGDVNSNGIVAIDDDGSAQTAALAISFTGLPEGAQYDPQTGLLNWMPGPGQIGDFVVSARVSDGRNTTVRTFTIRSVADAAANEPKILVSTTPSTPAQPGQTIVATVRADAYSGVANIAVEVRRTGMDSDQWQTVALDGAGRMRLIATQPGLIEVRVTAIDRDGFQSTQVHTIRVKDLADTQAPSIAWSGALAGATALGRPVDIASVTVLQASLQERQLMGYRLEIAPANSSAWSTLAEQSAAAADSNLQLSLASLDPALFANGVYQLRFSAWDLVGRTSEINARVIIDTAQKNLAAETVTDVSYLLGGHTLALTRSFDATADADFGNWRIPALDLRLTSDQAETTASGAIAPWQEGAVWLQVPDSLSSAGAAQQYLSFTLGTTSERLGNEPGAPLVWHPLFTGSQGWTLVAHGDLDSGPEMLVRQGHRLYSQLTGLPWVPTSYTLIGPDGTRYTLDTGGKVSDIKFAGGAQWLVSDAGVAAVTGDNAARVDFIRDTQGRISRVTGPGDTEGSDAKTMVYRYDSENRLILARSLNSQDFGTPYGYDAAGNPFADTITANLGAAVNWLSSDTANQWRGACKRVKPPRSPSRYARANWHPQSRCQARKARSSSRWKRNWPIRRQAWRSSAPPCSATPASPASEPCCCA
ncbi:putative Ig domain-containing protein [Polaromonas sp. P2-4]|nr:putative Ig domain-containing protein [Polaromonas sp. P2-4]